MPDPRSLSRGTKRHYCLFSGPDLALDFDSAEAALGYMADNADAILNGDCALMVFDDEGMCKVALVDARKLS